MPPLVLSRIDSVCRYVDFVEAVFPSISRATSHPSLL
jgi:hypothetical protein